MEKVIQVKYEEVPKGIYLARRCKVNITKEDGSTLYGLDLVKPVKKVIYFTEYGNLEVKYYQDFEWDGTEDFNQEWAVKFTQPVLLSHYIFKHWLNSQLEASSLCEIVDEILNGEAVIQFDDLCPASKDLVAAVRDWDNSKPFKFDSERVVCDKFTDPDDGTEFYDVRYFDL